MAFFVVRYDYRDVPALADVRPQHRSYLASLTGICRAAGPLPAEPSPAGLMIFEVADRAHLDGIIANDPLTAADLIVSVDVREWTPSIGEFAGCAPGSPPSS